MVGLYIRVSTDPQMDGYSPEIQEERGREFAVSIREEYEVFKEAKSGKKLESRLEWRRLVTNIETGRIQKVWAMDNKRFARNLFDSLTMIVPLKEHGACLYIGGRLVDFDNHADVLMFQIGQAVAEMNGKDITKYTTGGIRAAIKEGRWANWVFGYKIVDSEFRGKKKVSVWGVDVEESETVKHAFDMFLRGASMRAIAFELNREGRRPRGRYEDGVYRKGVFQPGHIHRMLKNPRYAGMVRNREGQLIPSHVYESVVSKKAWDAAQRRLLLFPSIPWRQRARHMVSGILHCAECGDPYHHSSKTRKSRRTGERTPISAYMHFASGKKCAQHPKLISGSVIDEMFTVVYTIAMQDRGSVEKMHEKELSRIERETGAVRLDVERIDSQIEERCHRKQRLLSSIEAGVDPKDIAPNIRALNEEIQELETSRVEKLKDINLQRERSEALLAEFAADNIQLFERGTGGQRHEMLSRVVKSATMNGRTVTVKLVTGMKRTFEYRPNATYLGQYDDTWTEPFYLEVDKAHGKRHPRSRRGKLSEE